ncbi:MAG: Sec-independent protein translocase subunit TatA [Intrasporangiaceae bacterium]|nr:Sec-independent protein translocase subunit TatA [Intrasporangiaceae bacterium]
MNFPRGTELIILLILLIIVFGWKRLPDAARSLGRSARVFKSEVEEMKKDGKDGAADAIVPGDAADDYDRPQQVTPPPAQGYQPPPAQAYQQPQHQQYEQPQAQPQQPPQQPFQRPGDAPDDPTRPVA